MISLLVALLVAVPLPPAPSKYVTDAANVIPDDRELQLNEKLAQFDRETTSQILVYVDRRVPEGTTLEEMGAQAIRTWRVGQTRKDNGAILFVFIDDRQSRIEAGYGLEQNLTDAKSKRILVAMRDALRAGDYAAAVDEGTAQMMTIIRAPAPYAEPPEAMGLAARYGISPAVVFGGLVAILGIVIAIIAWKTRKWRVPRGTSSSRSSGWDDLSSLRDSSSWSSSSDSSSSSSPSSSDFSGGGGDGGGGGASDRW